VTTVETSPKGSEGRGGRPSLPNGAYRALLAAVVLVFVGIVAWFLIAMVVHARPAFSTLGFSWIVQKTWDPSHNKFGLLPFILGTVETTAIAVVLAVPIGLGTALALAYLVPHRLRPGLSTAVELLAAVPSVVYGLWGLIVLAPLCREYLEPFLTWAFGWTSLFNGSDQGVGLLLAGIILFVMILPTMVALSRDVLAVVPNDQVEGAMALGATRWQVLSRVVVPGARTGILGAFTLATGRALGETVAVALVIGNSPFIAHSLKAPAATLPSLIVNNFGESTGTELSALFGAGLVLLVIGVSVNALARVLVRSAARGGGVAAGDGGLVTAAAVAVA
jgi:phosphate transport system permease protein